MNAASKVRAVFKTHTNPLKLADIQAIQPDLGKSEISMALCYLMRQRYLSRESVDVNNKKGRNKVWNYTYHETKLPKEPK